MPNLKKESSFLVPSDTPIFDKVPAYITSKKRNEIKKEVLLLEATDRKYAKNNLKTTKLWVAEKILLSVGQTEPTEEHISWFEEMKSMKRAWRRSPASAANVPSIKQYFSYKPDIDIGDLKNNIYAEINRLEKNDYKYTGSPQFASFKFMLFKSLLAELNNPEAPILKDPAALKQALSAIYAIRRGKEQLKIQVAEGVVDNFSSFWQASKIPIPEPKIIEVSSELNLPEQRTSKVKFKL